MAVHERTLSRRERERHVRGARRGRARALAAGTVELHGAAVRILGPTTIWDDNKGRPRLFQCLRLTISACGKGGQWKHALELLTEMQTRGLKPDVITFNAAISACERGGQWEHALELLTEMQTQGVTPDVITFGSAISACEQGGQWERALSLLKEMQTQGVEPDVRSFSAAISACEKGGQSERARAGGHEDRRRRGRRRRARHCGARGRGAT